MDASSFLKGKEMSTTPIRITLGKVIISAFGSPYLAITYSATNQGAFYESESSVYLPTEACYFENGVILWCHGGASSVSVGPGQTKVDEFLITFTDPENVPDCSRARPSIYVLYNDPAKGYLLLKWPGCIQW